MSPPPRVLVVGAGAIGGSIALALRGKCAVTIADPDPRVREAFAAQGLPAMGPDALGQAAGHADLAVIAVRAAIAPRVLDALPPGLPALCLCNGLNPALGERRPNTTLLGCVDFAASADGPGRPRLTQRGGLTMPVQSPENVTARLAQCLAGAPIAPHLVDDINGAVWSKAILNASLDPAAALSGRTLGGIFAHRPTFLLLRQLLREGLAVARAVGITLHPVQGTAIPTMDRVFHTPLLNRLASGIAARKARDVESTMLADFRRGVPTEAPYLNGAIADAAERAGKAGLAPTHRAVASLFEELLASHRVVAPGDIDVLLGASRR